MTTPPDSESSGSRLTLPADYQQDFIGSVPAYMLSGLYQLDPRYPFCAAGGCEQGEMVFTIIHEYRRADDPLYGYVSEGMYENNGVADATIQVFTDPDGIARFETPYPNETNNNPNSNQLDDLPDGLVYAGTMEELLNQYSGGTMAPFLNTLAEYGLAIILRQQEFPQPWREKTSSFGLAQMKYMEPGIYEAEVTHPTLTCLPTKDSWPGSKPNRVRFEVLPGTLGDVRFYCEGTK